MSYINSMPDDNNANLHLFILDPLSVIIKCLLPVTASVAPINLIFIILNYCLKLFNRKCNCKRKYLK